MGFMGEHNHLRAAILRTGPESPVVTRKKSRGDRSAQALTGKSVPRAEVRSRDMRSGDRHRLSEAEAIIRKGRRSYQVDLINISGGGAMVHGTFPAKLWQSVTLLLGDVGEVECAVRWIREQRYGLEFAHETRLDCDLAVLNETLRKVLTDNPPLEEVESPSPQPLEPRTAEPSDPRRAAKRHPLIWSGIVQFDHESVVVRLRNISADGAQIQSAAAFAVGQAVLLDLGNAGAVAATVRWSCGDQAGLAFHEPFNIRQLAKVQPQVAARGWVKPDFLNEQEEAGSSPWASQWGRLSVAELKTRLLG
jgi:hypothetical protein